MPGSSFSVGQFGIIPADRPETFNKEDAARQVRDLVETFSLLLSVKSTSAHLMIWPCLMEMTSSRWSIF